MTRLKNLIIEWLGISHMAGDVYRRLLREHEDRWEKNARARQAETINQLQEMLRQHCADESALRDGFAQGAVHGQLTWQTSPESYDQIARNAYAIADAMLSARRKK